MSLAGEVDHSPVVGVGFVDTLDDLSILRHQAKAAVIWNREPLDSFQSWIDTLEPDQLPKARVSLRPRDVRTMVRSICSVSGTPSCAESRRFVDDVAALADLFATIMRTPYLRLRLDVIDSNACRKFHIDRVTARLICTYRGTGTQYGTEASGCDPRTVFTVPTGNPIVLRGTLWPEKPDTCLRHRSPPIEGTDETRLVLILDPISDLQVVV
jgi:hypothetical protein